MRSRLSWLQCLPPYSRSLLKIKVPVTVTLATSKQSVRSILGTGARLDHSVREAV